MRELDFFVRISLEKTSDLLVAEGLVKMFGHDKTPSF
jgi:hypothetical protein